MKNRLLRTLLGISLCLCASTAWSACTLSAPEMQASIEHDGVKNVVSRLESNNQVRWYAFMDCIATGDSAWVGVAVSLGPQDASAGEDLNIYLGKALSINAENVLRLAIPVFDLDAVCGALDNDAHPKDWYLKSLDSQELGLSKIKSPDLENLVKDCRDSIERTRQYVQTHD